MKLPIVIYKITNPIGQIYIGSTKNFERRRRTYKHGNLYRQYLMNTSIEKYLWSNHTMEVVEEVLEENRYIRERYWQDFYNVLGENGLNTTLVASDGSNDIFSEEYLERCKNTNKNRKVYCYSIFDGSFLNEYKSVREASRKLSIDHSQIVRCCNNLIVKAHDYIFSYDFIEVIKKLPVIKPVNQIALVDKYDNILKIYKTMKEAAIDNDVDSSNISRVCNGIKDKTKNKKFKFI